MTRVQTSGTEQRVAVLAYHKIGDPPPGDWNDWFHVPEKTFADHLRFLADEGWSVIDIDHLLAGLEDPLAIPARSALITFDDADRSLFTTALPHLTNFGFPAVVFVATDFIGGANEFDTGDQPTERICGWDELRELASHRVSIEAHSASHRRFSKLGGAALADELRRPKHVLEDRLARPVRAFAYPFGDVGRDPQRTEDMVADAGYRAAFLYGGACPWSLPVADRYRLGRLAMGRDTDLAHVPGMRCSVPSRSSH